MPDYTLFAEELADLRTAHHSTRDKRETDRNKAIVLLARGRTAEQVAEAVLIDANTVRNPFRRFQQGGLRALARWFAADMKPAQGSRLRVGLVPRPASAPC